MASKGSNPGGSLVILEQCSIIVPGSSGGTITFNNLPDISDTKGAAYNDEPVMGRSTPLKSYSHSENRSISLTMHLFTVEQSDIDDNLSTLRLLESLVYPRLGNQAVPFTPPPVCTLQCGQLLGADPLCVVLRNYSVNFPTDVPWDESTYLPYKFDVVTQWDVVYQSTNLPGQEKIVSLGM